MDYLRQTPAAPLSKFVRCIWYAEGAPQTHSKERLLPTGEASIIFNLRDDPFRIYDAQDLTRFCTHGHAMFSGARSNCFVIDTNQQERVIGVQFWPGGAFPFFRMPVSEAEGISIELEDLWSRRAGEIRERLLAEPDAQAMIAELERCLMQQLARPLALHPAVVYALRRFRNAEYGCRVAELTEQIGLSSRRFIELFRQEVGLAPKTFYRVRRFQNVLETVHRRESVEWTRVALDCGYYDQAHFIHDFQSFSGLTPSAYLGAATPHLNHVPL